MRDKKEAATQVPTPCCVDKRGTCATRNWRQRCFLLTTKTSLLSFLLSTHTHSIYITTLTMYASLTLGNDGKASVGDATPLEAARAAPPLDEPISAKMTARGPLAKESLMESCGW